MKKRQLLPILGMIALLVAVLMATPMAVGATRQTVTPQDIGTTSFISLTQTTENGDGYAFANNGRCFLILSSAAGASATRTHYITVTTNATFHGFAVADLTDTIYSTSPKILGPFDTAAFNDSSGNVQIDMDPYGFTGDYRVSIVRY